MKVSNTDIDDFQTSFYVMHLFQQSEKGIILDYHQSLISGKPFSSLRMTFYQKACCLN